VFGRDPRGVRDARQEREKRRRTAQEILRFRLVFYVLILGGFLALRYLLPDVRSRTEPGLPGVGTPQSMIVAGVDVAPVLIPRITTAYRELYPELDIRLAYGGTRQALQDLANRKADLAFLNRRPTAEEQRLIATVGDTAAFYPVALGAIGVVSGMGSEIRSVGIQDVRDWMTEAQPGAGAPEEIYLPDPNLGLWEVLAERLGVRETTEPRAVWLKDEVEVAKAVAARPGTIGFVSLLAVATDFERLGARLVPVSAGPGAHAVAPEPDSVATGAYPLHHHVYLAYLPEVAPAPSGFVTFLYSPRGQRLLEREGFLPARHTARIVQLTQNP
jgi:phosphate transport system substrate-binding protein